MRNFPVPAIAAAACILASTAGAGNAASKNTDGGTLAAVLERGALNCGVSMGLAGFSAPDANGVWQGFDVALCRAVAAAVLGDPTAVTFVPTSGQSRFPALTSGQVDLLARNTSWTFSRDVNQGLSFVGIGYFDGQGFMVTRALGVGAAIDLDGAAICVQLGTTSEMNLADFFRVHNMTYDAVPVETNAEAQQQYLAGACDVYTTDISGLAATRASFADPGDHIILPDVISKEPLGPVVRDNDSQWEAIVHWTLLALIAAEELGVTSANVAELAEGSKHPEINRLLGSEAAFGAMLGLERDWAARVIAASGNYGEIFAATIGDQTPIGIARGLNAQWTQGGLLYAPPFR